MVHMIWKNVFLRNQWIPIILDKFYFDNNKKNNRKLLLILRLLTMPPVFLVAHNGKYAYSFAS